MFTANVASAYENNCWEWVNYRLDGIPPTVEIIPERRDPQVGDIAVMYYEKSGLTHYAVVEGVTLNHVLISETNMWHLYPSGTGYRFIPKDYANLQGYYSQ